MKLFTPIFRLIIVISSIQFYVYGNPKVEILSKTSISFGTYQNIEDRTAVVAVKNGGDSELAINNIRLTCSCMKVDGYPKSLAPGETGEVKVTIKKNELSGNYKRIFYIESNDPVNKRIRISVRGNAQPLFDVKCDQKPQLGVIPCGLVWTGRYSVVANYPDLSIGKPAVSEEGVQSRYTIITNSQEKCSYEVARVIIFEKPGHPFSSLLFPIYRCSDGEELSHVKLYASAVTKEPIRAVPDKIIISPSENKIEKRIMVSICDGKNPLNTDLIKCTSGISGLSSRISSCRLRNSCYLHLKFSPDYLSDMAKIKESTVTLTYNSRYSLTLPVKLIN